MFRRSFSDRNMAQVDEDAVPLGAEIERSIWPLAAFLAVVGAVYSVWMTVIWFESEDSLTFIGRILDDVPRYHPNHLLFEPAYHAALKIVLAVFPVADPIRVLQWITLAFALLGLGLVYRLVERRAGGRAALAAGSFVAVSFGFWHYATVVDAYLPALAFALLALSAFDWRPERSSPWWALMAAVFASAAVLSHQLYFVFAVLLGVFVLIDFRTMRLSVGEAVVYAVAGLVLVGGAYWLSYIGPDSAKAEGFGFLRWAQGYAGSGFGAPVGPEAPLMAVVGVARFFVTFNPFFGIPQLAEIAGRGAGAKVFVEEMFIGQSAIGVTLSLVLAVTAIAGLLLALWAAVLGVLGFGRRGRDVLHLILIAQVGVYTILATLWEAINLELWIHVVVFLTLFVFTTRAAMTRAFARAVIAATALIAVTNFLGAVRPYTDLANDYWRGMLAPVLQTAQKGDLVIIDCPWICGEYIETLTGAVVLAPSELSEAQPLESYGAVLLSSFALRGGADAAGAETSVAALTGSALPAASAETHTVWRRGEGGWDTAAAQEIGDKPRF